MTGPYATFTILVSVAVALWALVHVIINRPMSRPLHASQLVIAALFIILAIGGIVQLISTQPAIPRAEFLGYLLLSPIIPIGSWWWTRGDDTRIGSAIVVVVSLVMPILVVRIQQVWATVG